MMKFNDKKKIATMPTKTRCFKLYQLKEKVGAIIKSRWIIKLKFYLILISVRNGAGMR